MRALIAFPIAAALALGASKAKAEEPRPIHTFQDVIELVTRHTDIGRTCPFRIDSMPPRFANVGVHITMPAPCAAALVDELARRKRSITISLTIQD